MALGHSGDPWHHHWPCHLLCTVLLRSCGRSNRPYRWFHPWHVSPIHCGIRLESPQMVGKTDFCCHHRGGSYCRSVLKGGEKNVV